MCGCECRGVRLVREVRQRDAAVERQVRLSNVMLGCRGRELIGALLPGSLVLGNNGLCYYGPRVFFFFFHTISLYTDD